MNEEEKEKVFSGSSGDPGDAAARRKYVRPQITWREPYEPVSFGVSCAHIPSDTQCLQNGPTYA